MTNLPSTKNYARGLQPTSITELAAFAQMLKTAPDFLPDYKKKYSVGELVINMQYGLELGLSLMQSIQGIAIINGKPAIWGDHMMGIVLASGKLKDITEEESGTFPDDTYIKTCIAKRDGITVSRSFSVNDAKEAKLWGKMIWRLYPKRMMTMRARSWALRDLFADILIGIVAIEEAIDYNDEVDPLVIKSFAPIDSNGEINLDTLEFSNNFLKTLIDRLDKSIEEKDDLYDMFTEDDIKKGSEEIANEIVGYLNNLCSTTGIKHTKIIERVNKNIDAAIKSFIDKRQKK